MATYEVNLTVTGTITVPDPVPDPVPATKIVTVGQGGTETGFEAGNYGSIAPDALLPFIAASLEAIWWDSGDEIVMLIVSGDHANAGFTTMRVGDVTFARADADWFASGHGDETRWTWVASENPFGAVDTETTVTFS